MRLCFACLACLFAVGCESSLPPLNIIEPAFSYLEPGSDDAAFANVSSQRSETIAIVSE